MIKPTLRKFDAAAHAFYQNDELKSGEKRLSILLAGLPVQITLSYQEPINHPEKKGQEVVTLAQCVERLTELLRSEVK